MIAMVWYTDGSTQLAVVAVLGLGQSFPSAEWYSRVLSIVDTLVAYVSAL